MTGRNTPKTLVAEAFGEEFTIRTAAGYEYAGVLIVPQQDKDFPRVLVAKGFSHSSVKKRTRTENNRWRPNFTRRFGKVNEAQVMQVVRFFEATAPVVREFFGTHRVIVDGLFSAGIIGTSLQDENYTPGWCDPQRAGHAGTFHAARAGRSDLRRYDAEGWTVIRLREFNGRKTADFQVTELLKSMNTRKKTA